MRKVDDALTPDCEIGIDVDKHTLLSFGARNVPDEYPDIGDPARAEMTNGRIDRSDSIFDR